MRYVKNNKQFLKETASLDTKEMTDFIEWLINYAAQEGLFIPSSEEYIINQLFFDKQIDSQKQYLWEIYLKNIRKKHILLHFWLLLLI